MNWQQSGEALLSAYLKKLKSAQGSLVVLSSFGDLLLKSGKKIDHLDWTSIGSIFSAVRGAAGGLNKLLFSRTSVVQFGDPKKGYWLELLPENCLIVGIGVPHQAKDLKKVQSHLKSNSRALSGGAFGSEALDGMSEATVDAAIGKE
ncbi:MAG: hypothetical protein JWQ35_531 [Bacteriovoracaceae bacterium]|nr:hypothetical protein [Bacteriovoracaceae bacterium]